MPKTPLPEGMHVCGSCGNSFPNEASYIAHVCPNTGFTPADIEHQDAMTDGQASRVQEAALARGEEKG